MRWWWGPLCTRQKREMDFYNASSLKQQSVGRHVNKKKTIKLPVENSRDIFLFLNVSNINISDNKVHKRVVNSVDLNKYNQRFQVYFWIFWLTLTCHVSTNKIAPSYSLLDPYCRNNVRSFCVFQVGLYNELWRKWLATKVDVPYTML